MRHRHSRPRCTCPANREKTNTVPQCAHARRRHAFGPRRRTIRANVPGEYRIAHRPHRREEWRRKTESSTDAAEQHIESEGAAKDNRTNTRCNLKNRLRTRTIKDTSPQQRLTADGTRKRVPERRIDTKPKEQPDKKTRRQWNETASSPKNDKRKGEGVRTRICRRVRRNHRGDPRKVASVYAKTCTGQRRGLMSSFTGRIIFSGLSISSSSSLLRMPCSSTNSYTPRPDSSASLAILVEFL